MNFLKSKLVRVLVLLFIVGFLAVRSGFLDSLFSPKSVYAVGDLTVTWQDLGSGDVGPLFNITGFLPGDGAAKTVTVENGGTSPRQVSIGSEVTTSGILSDVLDIVISESGNDIYGGTTGAKTVSDFFTDSGVGTGIPLGTLAPGETKTYTIEVYFQESAGNEYQNQSIVFNLFIGLAIDIPEACLSIEDLDIDNPIYGTSKSESIKGTIGNDLIFGLEGHDKIDGKAGDDCIIGGLGNDALIGGTGNDVIVGNEGRDGLIGGDGDDLLIGNNGADSLDGGNGNDTLHGNDGADTLVGGNGEDELYGGNGKDALKGGNQDDILLGEGGADDAANGQLGTDSCNAEATISCEISL